MSKISYTICDLCGEKIITGDVKCQLTRAYSPMYKAVNLLRYTHDECYDLCEKCYEEIINTKKLPS